MPSLRRRSMGCRSLETLLAFIRVVHQQTRRGVAFPPRSWARATNRLRSVDCPVRFKRRRGRSKRLIRPLGTFGRGKILAGMTDRIDVGPLLTRWSNGDAEA